MLCKAFCVCFCVLLCVLTVVCQLDEGSQCVDKDGVNGTCVPFQRCLSVVSDLKMKKNPQLCSYKGRDPIVCCTDCELADINNAVVDRWGSYYFRTGSKAVDKCLEAAINPAIEYKCPVVGYGRIKPHQGPQCYNYAKINAAVGGVDALETQYPHMAFVKEKTEYAESHAAFPLTKCLEYRVDAPHYCILNLTGLNRRLSENKICYNYQLPTPVGAGAVGGKDAKVAQFPHMALLGFGTDLETAQWLCGGSLISDRFILTAGHCIASNALGPLKYAALGILKRSDPPEVWQRYNIEKIIPHPEYKPPSKYHDIALLQLDSKVKYGKAVKPACLNTGENEDFARVSATGWGLLGHRKELADTLQVVYLQEFTNEECAALYPKHRHLKNGYDSKTQMCYGKKNEVVDTCEGDSGGPLQGSTQYGVCIYSIIGVTSYGRQCGFKGSAGMYTRVSYYVPWIESIVWP